MHGIFFAFYGLVLLVYISTQAILGTRVYALYGRKSLHLAGLTFLCCILPAVAAVVEFRFYSITTFFSLLITYNALGVVTDLLLLLLILAHAVRSRSLFSFRGHARRATKSRLSLGKIVDSGSNILSLMVSESVKYYSITLTMYIVTSAMLGFRVDWDAFLFGADGWTMAGFMPTRIMGPFGTINGFGLVSLMTLLTGIMAPKLLLSIRREFYMEHDRSSSASQTRRTVSWRVAKPSTRDSDVGLSELGSCRTSLAEASQEIASESVFEESQQCIASIIESGGELSRNTENGEPREV